MDYNDRLSSNIRQFADHNELINFINKPTRVSHKYYKKSNQLKCSPTLLDLILHNGDLVDETDVIDCPFSDHDFVVGKFNIPKPTSILRTIACRNLSIENINKINSMIDELDYKQLYNSFRFFSVRFFRTIYISKFRV